MKDLKKYKNSYWLRHFLICDRIAKESCGGLKIDNFLTLILNEENGAIGNAQMTKYFWAADKVLADISSSEWGMVIEELEEELDIQELATLSEEELSVLYNEFIYSTTKI